MAFVNDIAKKARRTIVISLLLTYLTATLPVSVLQAAARPAGSLRLMTFNIHFGVNMAGRPDLRGIAAAIGASGADIVALQEVDRHWGLRSLFRDQATWLARRLGMNLAYAATLNRRPHVPGRGEQGLAILSRFPLIGSDHYLLPGELEQRGVLLARAVCPDGEVPVACLHLGLAQTDRRRQIEAALAWLPIRPDLVLMGDLNVEPNAPELAALAARLTDLQAACGLGDHGTYTYRGRPVRIDYIYAGSSWRPLQCAVPPLKASDHRPVVVEVVRSTPL